MIVEELVNYCARPRAGRGPPERYALRFLRGRGSWRAQLAVVAGYTAAREYQATRLGSRLPLAKKGKSEQPREFAARRNGRFDSAPFERRTPWASYIPRPTRGVAGVSVIGPVVEQCDCALR